MIGVRIEIPLMDSSSSGVPIGSQWSMNVKTDTEFTFA